MKRVSAASLTKLRIIGVLFSLVLMTGCGASTHSTLTPQGSKIVSDASFLKGSDSSINLRDSALSALAGMSQREAVFYLEEGGFSCVEANCVGFNRHRETTSEILFGISMAPKSKIFGVRKSSRTEYWIQILGEQVLSTDDIEADILYYITTGGQECLWERGKSCPLAR